MKNLFRLDSPFMLFLAAVWDLIVLNLLFLICCIPIVTIGPAAAALYTCTMRMVRKEGDVGAKAFFIAFGQNFKKSFVLWLIYIAVAVMLVVNVWLMVNSGNDYSTGIKIACVFVLAVYAASVSWVFPLQARFENPVLTTLRNSLVFSIANPLRTLCVIICTVFPFAFLYLQTVLFLRLGWFWLLLGFAVLAYVNSMSFVKVTEKVIQKREEIDREEAEKAAEEAELLAAASARETEECPEENEKA